MVILITGGAGFIGGHLCRALVEQGNTIICVDNLVLGSRENIADLLDMPNFFFYEENVADLVVMEKIFEQHQIHTVYHLVANSDIQKGGKEPAIDFNDTFLTTRTILECMRRFNVKKLFFASTSAIYGEKPGVLLKETTGDLQPVSYYGGAKFASEAFISSYAAMCDFSVVIFRFPNVIGPNLTHGVVFDFKRKLDKDPTCLQILGDGSQCKPYLHVFDLIRAITEQTKNFNQGIEIFNIGVQTATSVTKIADIICEEMGLQGVQYEYTGGNRGWKGDVPSFEYDLSKIHATGWRPQFTSDETVRETIRSVLRKV